MLSYSNVKNASKEVVPILYLVDTDIAVSGDIMHGDTICPLFWGCRYTILPSQVDAVMRYYRYIEIRIPTSPLDVV